SKTEFVLAVRSIYVPFGLGAYTSFFANRTLSLGNPDDLGRSLELWSVRGLFEHLPRLINAILLLVLAMFLLALYFTQKGHREYLWLALHELAAAPIGFIDLAGSSAQMDQLLYAAVMLQLILISAYFYFEFLVSFLSLRRRWYIIGLRYGASILAGVGPSLVMVGRSHFIAVLLLLFGLGALVWVLGWVLFSVITLINATVRRNYEAGLLLIPLV